MCCQCKTQRTQLQGPLPEYKPMGYNINFLLSKNTKPTSRGTLQLPQPHLQSLLGFSYRTTVKFDIRKARNPGYEVVTPNPQI